VLAPLYNRILGWIFFALGVIGLLYGHIGEYIRQTLLESLLHIGIGLFAMAAARTRLRYAVVAALMLGISCFIWGMWGAAWPASILGTSEPLEVLLRLLAGAWGMYVSVQDVLEWRRA
jgi:hypothetical protein